MNKHKQHFIDSDASPVFNDHDILDWFNATFYKTRETHELVHQLLKDNRADFKRLWGKQDFCTQDSANRRLHVWHKKFQQGELWFVTARERGTSVEWVPNNDEFAEDVKTYLCNVMSKLAD